MLALGFHASLILISLATITSLGRMPRGNLAKMAERNPLSTAARTMAGPTLLKSFHAGLCEAFANAGSCSPTIFHFSVKSRRLNSRPQARERQNPIGGTLGSH